MAAAVRGVSPGSESTEDPHTTRHLLAQRLRLLRTLRGWSQETLAEQAGLHRTCISGIEIAAFVRPFPPLKAELSPPISS